MQWGLVPKTACLRLTPSSANDSEKKMKNGSRVVRQTTRETIPDDFGLAESNERHGHIDLIVPRGELRDTVARVAWLLAGGTPYRRTTLLPDLGAQRAVGRILGGARRRIGDLFPDRDGG